MSLNESGNAFQAIAKCETRMQVVLIVREIARRCEVAGGVDWDRVLCEASRAESPFKSEVGGNCCFVRELSGGLAEPVLLRG